MKYLFIEVEVFVREFNSRFLIGLEAASRGYQVVIGHRNQIYHLALKNKLPKGIIHKKDINTSPEEIKIMKQIINRGFKFTAQDEEAGILHNFYEDFSKRRFDNLKATNLYQKIFTWGDRDKQFFENKLKNKNFNFIPTGSPRIDLCKKKFTNRNKYFSKRNKINKKFILITSNISFPISITPLVNRLDRIWKDTLSNREFKEKFMLHTQAQHTIILYEFLKCIRFLLENLDEYLFVIRPHTNETKDIWKKIIGKEYKNLKIVKDLTVIDNLSDAELLIHTGCTSAIEAYVANIPTVYYHPQNFEINYQRDLLLKINKVFRTKEEVLKFIKLNKYESLLKKNNHKEIKERIANLDEKNLAYIKIVDCFDEINIVAKEQFKYKKNKYIQLLKIILKKILFFKSFSNNEKIINIKFPDFNLKEINNFKENLSKNNNKFTRINLVLLDKKLIKLSK